LSAAPDTAARTLTLAEAVELAIAEEPLIAQAGIARERAELAVFRAQLDRFSLKVDAQLQELWAKTNIGGSRGESIDGGLGLSNVSANLNVPIFSGFRVEANVARAKHLDEASGHDLLRQKRDTALAVARAYWAVRKIGLLGEVQARALERLRRAEEIASSRVRAGLAPPIDENRAISRRMLQEATLADLDGQLREASEELAVALGLQGAIVLSDTPDVPAEMPAETESLLAKARSGRPELLLAQSYLDAQHETIRIAESGYYPQLSAFSLLQYGNNPFLAGAGSRGVFGTANPFKNMAGDFQIGVTLAYNIFDTLNTHTSVKDARYEQSRLAEESRRIARIIETDVRAARAKVGHFFEVRSRLQPAEALARDNLSIIQKRYENGEALVFELLDAELELLNIERQLADATSELRLAWLELDASLGAVVGEKR
jgi:outer membrane protein